MATPAMPSPKLHLPPDYPIEEAAERGYMNHALVELGPDKLYPVYFSTQWRVQNELDAMIPHGEPFIIETGLIVVREITLANLEAAVAKALAAGWFEYQVPLTRARVDAADPFHWPP